MGRDSVMVRAAHGGIATVLLAVLALAGAPSVLANGKAVTVHLGYLPEISTWGSYEASGQAYVNAGEGRANVTVHHMISDPAIRYEVWLVRADDREALYSLGTFTVDATGHADIELHNPELRPAEFRFLVISAEPAADDDPRPTARRTVAGVFPNAQARPIGNGATGFDGLWSRAAREAGAPGRAADAPTSPPPSQLPVSGGTHPTPRAAAFAMASAAALALIAAGAHRRRAVARARHQVVKGEEQ